MAINQAIGGDQRNSTAIIAHFRKHWVTMAFSDSGDKKEILVFDSAPSLMVRRDILRLTRHFGWPDPVFCPSPRQQRDSEECGLFATAAVLFLREGSRPPASGTFSLHSLRPFFGLQLQTQAEREVQQQLFLAAVKDIFGIDSHPQEATPAPSRNQQSVAPLEDPISLPAQEYPLPVPEGGAARRQPMPTTAPSDATPPPAPVARKQCLAHRQQKNGGQQCCEYAADPKVDFCKLHLLMAHVGTGSCNATTKAGRPCPNKETAGLGKCPFHVDDNAFTKWLCDYLASLTSHPAPLQTVAPSPEITDALTHLEDPDFEDELGGLIAVPWKPEQINSQIEAAKRPFSRLPEEPFFGDLIKYVAQRGPCTHPLAELAWQQSTLLGHARSLRQLSLGITDQIARLPMTKGVLETLNRRRQNRHWRWSTMLRNMAELQGALAFLPVSRGLPAIELGPEWLAALKGAASQAKSERPRVPLAATPQDILGAIRSEPHRPTKLLTATSWLCCGRTGDCRQLAPADIKLESDGCMTVTFYRGKTIGKRGPYSLHTVWPPGWLDELGIDPKNTSNDWVASLHQSSVQKVLVALRRVKTSLENRSIRRGALQTLAQAGTSESVLLDFSGHTNVSTLRRYLGWGSIGEDKRQAMTTAATALAPPSGAGTQKLYSHDPYRMPVLPQVVPGREASPDDHPLDRMTSSGKNCMAPMRWLQYLGAEAPPTDELPGARHYPEEELPLHSKDVAASFDYKKCLALARSPELAAFATESFRWLHDPRKYEELL